MKEMRERQERNALLGTRASANIFADLAASTFAEEHPIAYMELRKYKEDIAGTIEKTLNRARCL